MEFIIQLSAFNSFWDFCAAELFSVMSEMLFYGILLVLVAFAANLLLQRNAKGGRLLLYSTVVMFVLATLQFVFRVLAARKAYTVFYLAVAGQFQPQSPLANVAAAQNLAFNFVEDLLLVTNNAVTDGILIYRCWLIWARNYRVIIVPSVMLFLTTILSYLSAFEGDYPSASGPAVDLRIGFLLGLLTNIVLVGLTAGRIYYKRRMGRNLQTDVIRRYNTAIAMVLESGTILTVWVVIYLILRSMTPPTVWRIFRGGLAMLLNIVPTLIVVRVGLGHSINESERTRIGTVTSEKNSV
ncbi:hypothetical protein C8R45DRAFT_1094701 [Mycena sanguinolenta]|nr:hypothetical protein C8R45DRAFT_1094701 [Mycena sanguinolenta]